jgi:hypothetical protein
MGSAARELVIARKVAATRFGTGGIGFALRNRRLNHAIHMAAVTQIRHDGISRPRLLRLQNEARARPASKIVVRRQGVSPGRFQRRLHHPGHIVCSKMTP